MKKIYIVIIAIILVLVLVFFIPVKSEIVWINDSKIAEIGHYEEVYYNLFGIKIRREPSRGVLEVIK